MKRRFLEKRALAIAGFALALAGGVAASPSYAQAPISGGDGAGSGIATPDNGFIDSLNAPVRSVTPSRLRNLERREFEAEDMERRRLEMAPSRIRADIAEQLSSAGVQCRVTTYRRIGTTPEANSIYEAACADDIGYILVNGYEPTANSCLVLANAAKSARMNNPNATAGAQCSLPENQNNAQVIGDWAKRAGATCRIDQAEWLGKNTAGTEIYEIGCQDTDGYWLEKSSAGWSLKGCLEIIAEGGSCALTTAEEQNAWMRERLAGSRGAACAVSSVRMIGLTTQGNLYEARCGNDGSGYRVTVGKDGRAGSVVSL